MLCEKCQSREADIHFAVFRNGHLEAHHLCAECAASCVGDLPVSPVGFQKFLQRLESALSPSDTSELPFPPDDPDLPDPEAPDPDLPDACPVCGLSSADLSLGRRGCVRCYSLVRRSARAFPHDLYRGPVPPGLPPAMRREADNLRLRARLRDAVARRDYETAAELRRQLQPPPPAP
jgi:protein arginine kinase activator